MSDVLRIAIGIATGFSSIAFVLVGIFEGPTLPAGSLPFYAMAALCALVALACFSRRSRRWALRVIGLAIFCGYLVYAIVNHGGKNEDQAFKGLLFLGLPSLYLAVRGFFPKWGFGAAAFSGSTPDQGPEDNQQEPGRTGSAAE